MAFICGWFLVVAYLTNVPMNSTAIGLIVDGLDGDADILKFGFHYSIAGFDIYMGEMMLAMAILILFGWLNIIGVKKAGYVQTILSSRPVNLYYRKYIHLSLLTPVQLWGKFILYGSLPNKQDIV